MNLDEVKKEKEAFTDEEDTTYDLLLKQQQLYLQWQLENQNKVIKKTTKIGTVANNSNRF